MNKFLFRVLTGAVRIIPLLTVCFVLLHASAQAQVTGMRVGSGAARIRIVLDLDSPLPGRFAEEDRAGLEGFVRVLERNLFPEEAER